MKNMCHLILCVIILVLFNSVIGILGQQQQAPNKCTTGKHQSPVNVNLYKVRPKHFNPLFWSFDYFQVLDSLRMVVTEETVRLDINKTHPPHLGGGPLDDFYKLDQVHFHWGANNHRGSEHTIDSKMFPMEMHAVHIKGDLSFNEALLHPDGIVVIGYLIEPEPLSHHRHYPSSSELFFQEITNVFPKISKTSRETIINSKLALVDLVVPFTHDYLTYKGSLTTPQCDESVIWIISPLVLKISEDQLDSFRDLYHRDITKGSDNWRITQPLNGRKIYRSRVPYPNFLEIHDHPDCHFGYDFETPDDDFEENVIDSSY